MDNYLKKMGSRIRSEFNDLKRTLVSASKELDIDLIELENIISGNCNLDDTHKLIFKIGEKYSIDISDLFLLEDDCDNGVKLMKGYESKLSSRIYDRKDKDNNLKPYYDYRDTAMSKLCPFKPEWIRELRVVENSDPNNPDVVYNVGHLMHQMTFFIGPVNYYWKDENGKSYCKEFNTGDSNYITPYYPHSFTSRDKNKDAIIIAVTFGGDVRRSLKEMYWMGKNRIQKFIEMGKKKSKNIISIPTNEHANLKHLGISDSLNKEYHIINSSYKIKKLMDAHPLSICRGFNIEVLSGGVNDIFESSFHTYAYNYGDSSVYFYWENNGINYKKLFEPGDSIYIQPFIKYSYENKEKVNANIVSMEVVTSINESTQIELSCFLNNDRLTNETERWF